MATTILDATAGSASANTYATLVQADAYHDDRLPVGSVWIGASDATDSSDAKKNKALLMATRSIDDFVVWEGWVVDDTQVLLWPRQGLTDHTGIYQLSTTVIPTELIHATAELGRQLLANIGRTDDSDVETLGITRLKAGAVDMTFSDDVKAKVIPDLVAHLIPPHWYSSIRGRNSGTRELVRA